ncbi:MAG: glycogen debranching protein [Alphaproteobacteria bacterium]|nr:glycogen debranching protein [Alphaproteobacteria bacterium]
MTAASDDRGATAPSSERLGRDICADLEAAERREWLVTNGAGAYASGTVAGLPTRGYHGLLVAALQPPVGRTLELAAALETVALDEESVELGTVRWRGGAIAPAGYAFVEEFRLDGTVPVWRYATPRFTLEKRIWMDQGANVTRIAYANHWSDAPLTLSVKLLTDHRDYHGRTFASGATPAIAAAGDTLSIEAPGGPAATLHVRLDGGRAEAAGVWYRGVDLARERDRGLTDAEDHLFAGTLTTELAPGATVQLVASVGEAAAAPDAGALDRRRRRDADLLSAWTAARGEAAPAAPDWVARLVLAADQFVVERRRPDGTPGRSVIAGYHWFSDWGRDTMISLPGLAIETGRLDVARSILLSFADAIDGGMIPNRFPDQGEPPEFNTVDATFWFIEAIRAYYAASGDTNTLATLFAALDDIIAHHVAGTRYGIGVDPRDGLVRAGEPGVQLTWMDAKVGDWVVTPRIGKPVEVNALWCSGLAFMVEAAGALGKPADRYRDLLERASTGFRRFWNPERGHCFDVLDGPHGHDPALRPNQVMAASLPGRALPDEQLRAVVRTCERALSTPAGLRSLAPGEPGYTPHYGGDQRSRDGAYHQGTVWGWLIGPFVEAHLALFGDIAHLERILRPLGDQLRIEGVGTVGEIFEAAPPHAPRGCIAQAWSVAEYLRAWSLVDRAKRAAGT